MSSADKVPEIAEKKKRPQPKGGSRKGVPNKATALAREAIAQFVDANAPRLQGWLDDIAADPKHGPVAAFKCVQDLLEYHIPKLQRTEHTGKDGEKLTVTLSSKDAAL